MSDTESGIEELAQELHRRSGQENRTVPEKFVKRPGMSLQMPCFDCGKDTGHRDMAEYYMVLMKVWMEAGKRDATKRRKLKEKIRFLCIGCLESRIGRQLTKLDFEPDVPINDPAFKLLFRSGRLIERLST